MRKLEFPSFPFSSPSHLLSPPFYLPPNIYKGFGMSAAWNFRIIRKTCQTAAYWDPD
jgi:hypothetical protein